MLQKNAKRYMLAMIAVAVLAAFSTMIVFAASGSLTLDANSAGLTADYTGNGTWSGGGKTATGSVEGTSSKDSCGNVKNSSQNSTLTLKNTGTEAKTLSFKYKITSNTSSITIDGTACTVDGSFSKELAAQATVSIVLTSGKGSGNITSIELSEINLVGNETVSTTFAVAENGSYTVNGTTITQNTSFNQAATDAYAVVATADPGYVFFGWQAEGQGYLSYSNETALTIAKAATVKPIFVDETLPHFLVGSDRYYDLNAAITAAGTSGTIVVYRNGTLPAGNYTIPSGVTLLVPFDAAGTIITNNMADYLLDNNDAKTMFRKLTMSDGAKLIVNGSLNIGSRTYRQMTGQAGPYGAIEMMSGSEITINNGATMYAWGYVIAGTDGSGTVTVESGGMVYENLSVMDYPGSASTALDIYGGTSGGGSFPMRAYTVRNVEVPMTFKSGAKESAFYTLYGTTAGYHNGYTSFIGLSSDSPVFVIESGGTMEKSFSGSKQILNVRGSISLNSLQVTMKSIKTVTVTSSKTSGVPLPSGFELNILSGTATLNENVILTEGTKTTVAQGATVNLNGKSIYILDADDDAGSAAAKDRLGKQYSPVNTDAILDINGTVIANGGFYTSTKGASIISSQGTGRIEITGSSTSTTLGLKTGTSTASTVNITQAQLQHQNGDYLASQNTTYVHTGTRWVCETHTYGDWTRTKEPTCTATGEDTRTCSVCGATETREVATLPHTPGTAVEENRVEATFDAAGSYDSVVYCTVCKAELSRETKTIDKLVAVAQIGDVKYTSLEAAVEAASAGTKITLLKDTDETITINKCLVILTNGHTAANVTAGIDGNKNQLYLATSNQYIAVVRGITLVSAECAYSDAVILRMKFYIPDDFIEDSPYIITLHKDGRWPEREDLNNSSIAVKGMTQAQKDGLYWAYIGVASGEMTRAVTTTVLDADNTPCTFYQPSGAEVGTEFSYTVKQYVVAMLNSSRTDKQKNTAKALAFYGGYAQQYFGVSTDNLAFTDLPNVDMSAEEAAVAAVTADDVGAVVTEENYDENFGIRIKSLEPFLDYATYLRLRFILADGGDITDYTFTLTLPGGGTQTLTAQFEEDTQRYYVDITDIPAARLDYDYTITVTKKAGNSSYTVKTSVMAWVKLIIAKSSDDKQIMMAKALYLYNQAANDLFE